MTIYRYAVAAVFGLAVGSFMNVVVHRLPRGLSVVRPRSFCPRCRRPVQWRENMPILSWLALRARCAGCGAPISVRYPIVEAAGGALAVAAAARFGFTVDAAFAYAFLMALLAITLIDWDYRIIPDGISIPFIAAGLAWSVASPRLGLAESALGALAGGGSLLAIGEIYRLARKAEGMGGGDVKLMAMIGAFLGVRLVLPVVLIASLAGSIYGLALVRGGRSGRTAVAFGSFLAPAAAVCLFAGESLVSWYLGSF